MQWETYGVELVDDAGRSQKVGNQGDAAAARVSRGLLMEAVPDVAGGTVTLDTLRVLVEELVGAAVPGIRLCAGDLGLGSGKGCGNDSDESRELHCENN